MPSVIGKAVQVKIGRHKGQNDVVVGRSVSETRLYRPLMRQPYEEVQRLGLWHLLRMYNRLIMAGASVEALVEGFGSMLSQATQSHVTRPLSEVIDAVRLQSYGISDSSEDASFIKRCLDI